MPVPSKSPTSARRPVRDAPPRIGRLIEKDPAVKKQMMTPVDGVDRGNIEEIVRYVRSAGRFPCATFSDKDKARDIWWLSRTSA